MYSTSRTYEGTAVWPDSSWFGHRQCFFSILKLEDLLKDALVAADPWHIVAQKKVDHSRSYA